MILNSKKRQYVLVSFFCKTVSPSSQKWFYVMSCDTSLTPVDTFTLVGEIEIDFFILNLCIDGEASS